MKSVFTIILLLFVSKSFSQGNYFVKNIDFEPTIQAELVAMENCGKSFFYLFGNTVYDNASTGVFYKIDNYGKIYWEKGLGGNTSIKFTTVSQTNTSDYIIAGANIDHQSVEFLKISNQGTLLLEREYMLDNITYSQISPTTILEIPNNDILIAGTFVSENQKDAFVMVYSSTDDRTKSNVIGKITADDEIVAAANANGKILILGNTLHTFNQSSAWIAEIDRAGNILKKNLLATNLRAKTIQVQTSGNVVLLCHDVENNYPVVLYADSSFAVTKRSNFDNLQGLSANNILLTSTESYFLYGSLIENGNHQTDAFILKTDTSGIIQWMRRYGNEYESENCYALKQLSDNQLMAVCTGNRKWIMLKTNEIGYIPYDGDTNKNINDNITYFDILGRNSHQINAVVPYGEQIFAAGSISNNETDQRNMFCFSLNGENQINWAKELRLSTNEEAVSVSKTSDGFLVLSQSASLVAEKELIIYKFNEKGDTLWSKRFKTNDIQFKKIQTDINDDFVIAGTSDRSTTENNVGIVLIKMDKNAELLWETSISTEGYWEYFEDITPHNKGWLVCGYNVKAGRKTATIILLSVDSVGKIAWKKNIAEGKSAKAKSVCVDNNNHIVVAGTISESKEEDENVLLMKFDEMGNKKWSIYKNIYKIDQAAKVAINQNNEIVVAGNTGLRSDILVESYGYLWKTNTNGEDIVTEIFGDTYGITKFSDFVINSLGDVRIFGYSNFGWNKKCSSTAFYSDKKILPPPIATITSQTPTSIKLTWVEAFADFIVEYDTSPVFVNPAVVNISKNQKSIEINNLSPDTRYYFRLKTLYNHIKHTTAAVSVKTPTYPDQKIQLQLASIIPDITLRWNINTDSLTTIELQRAKTPDFKDFIGFDIQNSYTFVQQPESHEQYYYYRIKMQKNNETFYSNIVDAKVPYKMYPPENLTKLFSSAESFVIGWTDNSINETGFVVRRSEKPDFSTYKEFILASNDTIFTDYEIDSETALYYKVASFSSDTISEFTEAIMIEAPQPAFGSRVSPDKISARVFPNPTKNATTIEYNLGRKKTATLTLYDINSNPILKIELTAPSGKCVLDTSLLNPGIYFYNITTNDASATIDKLLIIK